MLQQSFYILETQKFPNSLHANVFIQIFQKESALNLIVFGEKVEHLDLMEVHK